MFDYIQNASDLKTTWTRSALYSGQNSTIRIAGPTKISNYGVAALAEDHSKIEIGIPLTEAGTPDTSLDPTDTSGHSLIELHSTRACLVANNKSTIQMKKLGAEIGSTGIQASSINTVESNLNRHTYHTNSFVQFYPNAFSENLMANNLGKDKDQDFGQCVSSIDGWRNRTTPGFDSFASPNRHNHNSNSTGGMCVRAVGGSNVLVDQVNFEVRMPVVDLSGAYYNLDGSGNEGISVYAGVEEERDNTVTFGDIDNHYGGSKIFMWNIADTSRIVASNLQVNGVDPSAAGFYGPAGRWGAPSDAAGAQESMGPLDYYGDTGAYQVDHGKANAQYNYGPFRLMAGVNSDLMTYTEVFDFDNDGVRDDVVVDASSLGGTAIAQVNAQGYAGPGVGAYPLALSGNSDFRGHMLIEPQRDYPSSVQLYGQPIFGGRPGVNADKLNIVGDDRRYFANSMIEDAELSVPADLDDGSDNIQLFPNFPIPPIHMEWQGYLRNFLDESAAETFANAKHGASKMVKLCSIFRSHTDPATGGEGRDGTQQYTYGHGVRSLNLFDLDKLI